MRRAERGRTADARELLVAEQLADLRDHLLLILHQLTIRDGERRHRLQHLLLPRTQEGEVWRRERTARLQQGAQVLQLLRGDEPAAPHAQDQLRLAAVQLEVAPGDLEEEL